MYRNCNACLCHATMWAAHSSSPCVIGCQHAYINRVMLFRSPFQETWLSPTYQLSLRHWGTFLHSHPQPTTLQPLAAAMMLSLPPTRPLQQSWWVRQAWQELAPPANTRPRRVSIALETMLSSGRSPRDTQQQHQSLTSAAPLVGAVQPLYGRAIQLAHTPE